MQRGEHALDEMCRHSMAFSTVTENVADVALAVA